MIKELTRLPKDTLIYGIGNGVNSFVSLLVLPLFTRYLSPSEYGIITILAVIGAVGKAVFGLGLGVSTGILYFQGTSDVSKKITIGTSFLILACSGIILILLGNAYADKISSLAFRDERFGFLVVLFLVGVSFQLMTQPFLLELQFRNQALKFILVSSLTAFITIGAMLILVVYVGRGIRGWVEGGLIGSLCGLSLCFILIGSKVRLVLNMNLARELFKLGLPIVPSFACIFVIQYSGTYLLQWFVSFDQIGIYGIGYNLGMALGLATGAFTTAWYPFFQSYVTRQEDAQRIFSNVLTYYTLGFGILCFLFSLLAKPVVFLMTEARYHSAYKVVGIVAFAQFCLGLWSVLLPGMYFTKETYYVPLVQGVTAICIVVFNLLLIPTFGIEGAAASMAAGSLVMVWLQHLVNRLRNYQVTSYDWYRPTLVLSVLTVLISVQASISSLPMRLEIFIAILLLIGYCTFNWYLLSGLERKQLITLASGRPTA